jgi:hypothetical protein
MEAHIRERLKRAPVLMYFYVSVNGNLNAHSGQGKHHDNQGPTLTILLYFHAVAEEQSSGLEQSLRRGLMKPSA